MKLKEKMKRFWSMDVHNHEGFTLVELIIVIAILAILSSVAVAGYSAYIEKANVAADEALLYEINLAFQTACIEAGKDIATLNNNTAKMPINDDGTINMAGVKPEGAVCAAFDKYFDVANAKFKVITSLTFVNGVFYNSPDAPGYTAYTYGGGTLYLSASDIAALQGSTFAQLGMGPLMDRIDLVTDFVGELNYEYWNDEGFKETMAKALGVTIEGNPNWATEAEVKAQAMAAKMDKCDKSDHTECDHSASYATLANNALVLYAAQNTVDRTDSTTTVLDTLGSADAFNALLDTGKNGTPTDFISQTAMAYAMYTAYANRNNIKDTDPEDILDALRTDNSDFTDYIKGEGKYTNGESQSDLEGYLAALGMMEGSMDDEAALESLLMNGFNDPELVKLLQGAMGETP